MISLSLLIALAGVAAPDAPFVSSARKTSWVALWREGQPLRVDAPTSLYDGNLLIGDQLEEDQRIECPAPCRILMLADGKTLFTLQGPGRWWLRNRRVISAESTEAELLGDELETYHEQSSASRVSHVCPLPESTFSGQLELLSPETSFLLEPPTWIRWRSPDPEAPFDLELTVLESNLEALERWSNLRSGDLLLTTSLEPGRRFRVRISSPRSEALAIERTFSIASPSEFAFFQEALQAIDALSRHVPPEVVSVLRARFFESHGLFGEARPIWLALSKSHPSIQELSAFASGISWRWPSDIPLLRDREK